MKDILNPLSRYCIERAISEGLIKENEEDKDGQGQTSLQGRGFS